MESQTGTWAQERLTRTEVAQAVRDAFGPGPAGRAAILACAERSNAREEVLAVLRRLPAREFADVRQLWRRAAADARSLIVRPAWEGLRTNVALT